MIIIYKQEQDHINNQYHNENKTIQQEKKVKSTLNLTRKKSLSEPIKSTPEVKHKRLNNIYNKVTNNNFKNHMFIQYLKIGCKTHNNNVYFYMLYYRKTVIRPFTGPVA